MISVSSVLIFLWLCISLKAVLFWIYLWQLKEYHIGRFLDHFNTEKGKNLLFNWQSLFKIIFLIAFFAYPILIFFAAILFYIFQFLKLILDIFARRLKKPVFTKKTVFLVFSSFVLYYFLLLLVFFNTAGDIATLSFWLLLLDFISPIIVSLTVLLLQPLAVFGRNILISKAREKRKSFPELKVVGVTGSYGKTSTKDLLHSVLSFKFNALKTKEHQNSEVGISQCIISDLNKENDIFVVEMGAYNRGGIKLLCSIANPQTGIITGINEQHMATFGSQENILKAKFELAEYLPQGGTIIVNWDNQLIADYVRKKENEWGERIKILKYSLSEKEDLWAENIFIAKDSVSFRMVSKEGESADFKMDILGKHSISNVLAAALAAKNFGMNLDEISKSCSKITLEKSALKIKKNNSGWNIIDSTYSANPEGVISDLEYLKIWTGKKILIIPCLIELGKSSKEVHERIGKKIFETCDLAVITTKDRFKEIEKEAGEKALFIEESEEIFEKIKEVYKDGDVILLESRVPKKLISLLGL